jgi:hypothetical protein
MREESYAFKTENKFEGESAQWVIYVGFPSP